jgi:biopolymer transport protein ExbD
MTVRWLVIAAALFAAQPALSGQPSAHILAIKSDGTFLLDGRRYNDENEFRKALERIKSSVVIRPDKNARYDQVAKAFATLQRVGVVKIGFINIAQSQQRPANHHAGSQPHR